MRKENHRFPVLFILLLFCLLAVFPVYAQEEDAVRSASITKVDLGVDSLDLAVGESYTFDVAFEPADTVLQTLDWYVTDEDVISIDPLTDTVTALAAGEARILAESFDGFSYAVCTVTVGGSAPKDAAVMKSGSEFFGLSAKDLKKISAESLNRYLDFIADSALDESSYQAVSARWFDVLAAVKPGKEEAQSLRAAQCGVDDSEPLRELNAVTLTGSLDSILKYAIRSVCDRRSGTFRRNQQRKHPENCGPERNDAGAHKHQLRSKYAGTDRKRQVDRRDRFRDQLSESPVFRKQADH